MDTLLTGRIPDNWSQPDEGRDLHVVVVYTGAEGTRAALRYAAGLPHAERTPVRLLVPQVVGYPLPLHQSQVDLSLLSSRYRSLAAEAGVEVEVEILLCRDRWEAIQQTLATPQFVVIGGRRRWWWPTREERIANRLRAQGHYVAYSDLKRDSNV
ncbi:MAG TPA: universal stress protein [Paludibaculum sp.]|jgi:hypothetical protein